MIYDDAMDRKMSRLAIKVIGLLLLALALVQIGIHNGRQRQRQETINMAGSLSDTGR